MSMFLSKWITNWAAKREKNKLFDTFRRLLHHHINESLYNEDIPSLYEINQDAKDSLVRNLEKMIDEIYTADDPFLEERKTIASLVYRLAAYQVLAMTEEDKQSMADYADVPWLSGQLHFHLPVLAKHFEELDSDRREYGIPDEELQHFCYKQTAVLTFYLVSLDLLRAVYKDSVGEKDWERPYLVAMMIFWESKLRYEANLDDLGLDSIVGIAYSQFSQFVGMGADNPLYEFDRFWKGLPDALDQPDKPHYLPM